MRKIFTLFILLLLLPVTAVADNPTTFTVGGTTITSSGYWTTNADGTLTAEGASADNYNVYYNGNGTLTLKDATINGTDIIGHVGAGIYAEGDLTIVVEGSSTVKGVQDPNGDSQSIRVSENLTIQGGGSLTAQGADTSNGSSYGIFVIGSFTQQGGSVTASGGDVSGSYNSTGLYVFGSSVTVQGGTLKATGGATGSGSYGISANGSVTVSDATVTATSGSAGYASYGLYIGSSSPSVTLSGSSSLTARSGTATSEAGGIYLDNPRGSTGSVTVGDNSTLLANSVILYDNSFTEKPLAPTGDGSWLIYGQSNQTSAVGGNYTLEENLTIESGNTLTIPAGSTLTVPQGKTLTVNGTLNIANQSSLAGEGTLDGSGNFYLTNPEPVISGDTELTYTGTDQFSKFKLEAPTGTVTVMEKDFTISSSPSLDGWNLVEQVIKNAGTYTLTASHTNGGTIQKQVTVSKATSSIAFNNYSLNYTYTGQPLANPAESELTLSGAGYNDVTFTWYKGSVADANKLDSAPKDAGTYYLVVSIADSDNTSGSSTTSGEIAISPAPLYVFANANSKIYGEADPTLTYQCIGLVDLDILTGELSRTEGENVGDYAITLGSLSAGSNYTLSFTGANLTITAKPVTLTWSTPTTFTYDGNEHSVTAEVTNAVDEDTFSLTYDENAKTAVGNYTAKVTGLGNSNYTLDGVENTTLNWEIVGASIAEATVELSEDEFTYTGSEQKPTVTVKLGDTPLTKDTDYTVAYSDKSINAGEYTVTVTGKGNYSGTATATYTISPAALTITGATLASKTYDGTTNATVESVTFSGLVNSESLSMDTDYTATAVFDDANAGTGKSATVTVTLSNGNYSLATSTYTLENQTIARADFDGTTEISGSVLASHTDFVTLPDIPDGASYGDPNTSDDLTDLAITGSTLSYTGGSSVTSGGTYTITVPVTGATNYVDYTITVTLTGKKIVTVEAVGSENPSFSTSQDRFTLTATIRVDDGSLAPTTNSWTWAVADDDVAALSGSPTLRNVSVSSSDQTFEIKGPGTTTITATYDDGTYRGSVDFTVRISKPTTPDPDPVSYYNIYVEDVCDGVEVTLSNNVVREGNSISVYVKKDTANYTFDNFKVYYKRSYYGVWEVLEEGVQPGEYPIRNIWTHIYIKAEGAEEKEDPTGIESIEGVKVYTKDGSLYVQTPQREQFIIVSMSGAVVKNEEQIGLKQYHGLQPGIYIVRVGDRAYKVRLN